MILADWAPPLLVLGLTPAMFAAARAARRGCGPSPRPPFALAFWLAAWYVLHVPAVYGYALEHRWALGLEHLAFLLPGLVFWWAVARRPAGCARRPGCSTCSARSSPPRRSPSRSPSPSPLYDFYEHAPKLWGLSPLEDQQIGAIAMAIEQAAILFAACSIAFVQWLDEDEAPPRPVGFPT